MRNDSEKLDFKFLKGDIISEGEIEANAIWTFGDID